jgi:hypothetical protein
MLPAGFNDWLGRYCWEVMGHIPVIARSDFHRFGSMKKHLAGKQFATDSDEKLPVTTTYRRLHSGATFGHMLKC